MVAVPVDHQPDQQPAQSAQPDELENSVPERYATTSPELTARLEVRRGRVGRLRRRLGAADLVVSTAAVVALVGHPTAQLASAAVCLVAVAHVLAAESTRNVVALRPIGRAVVAVVGAACVVLALLGDGGGSQVLTGAAIAAAALSSVRLVARAPRFADRFGVGHRRRLIVGDPQALEGAAARRTPAVDSGEVILVVTRAETPSTAAPDRDQRQRPDGVGGPSGMVERVVRTALDNAVERVTVIPGLSWQQPQLRELSWLLEGTGIDMIISTNLDGIAPHRVDVVRLEGRLMIRVGSASHRGARALAKGAVDRLAAAVLLTLASPFLLAVAVAIRLDSPGPAVFRQRRVRERGETFTIYKFRTMRVDADRHLDALRGSNKHGDGPLFKMEDDPRITRLGRLLRTTSLDELPQLVNVLLGQMSLIGPRPALPCEVDAYDHVARRRLAVKPGMTGLWQVSGRSRLSWEQSIGYDLDYVDNWSPVTDAAIAMRTFRAVMGKDGAF